MNEERKFTGRDALVALAIRHDGDWNAVLSDIKGKIKPTDEELANAQDYKGGVLTLLDDEYPDYLKRCPKPPIVLFYKGDLSLMKDGLRRLSLADTEKNTKSDEKVVKTLVGDLNDAFVLCGKSDTADLLSELGKKRIFVVDDLDEIEIEDGELNELAVSETPIGHKFESGRSPSFKSRIASSMGDLLVLKAKKNDISAHEVGYSLTVGREVFVAPRAFGEPYINNQLIGEGAIVALDFDTINGRPNY